MQVQVQSPTTTNPQPQLGAQVWKGSEEVMLMMPRVWVAATTQWYKSHRCRRYKSYWESILRQLWLQNWKQGGWVESNSWIFIIPPLLLLRLQKSMLEFLLVFQFGLFICIQYSAFLFVFGSKTHSMFILSRLICLWRPPRVCWWLLCWQREWGGMKGNVTSKLGSEEIGQKTSTAQSYKDVGALKTPRFRVFHILQQGS